jgi:hypothetical protein
MPFTGKQGKYAIGRGEDHFLSFIRPLFHPAAAFHRRPLFQQTVALVPSPVGMCFLGQPPVSTGSILPIHFFEIFGEISRHRQASSLEGR